MRLDQLDWSPLVSNLNEWSIARPSANIKVYRSLDQQTYAFRGEYANGVRFAWGYVVGIDGTTGPGVPPLEAQCILYELLGSNSVE